MRDTLQHLREQLVGAAGLLFGAGVMQHSGHANMSARLEGERILLTARGSIRGLTTDDIVVVDFDGHSVEGHLEPTNAEIVSMHVAVYRDRPEVGAVIHTHSPHVSAFALAHQPLPCAYEALLRFGVSEPIPLADWAPRGSAESVANIVAQMRQHPATPAVLLANHGVLAFGADPLATAQLVISLEEAAALTLLAQPLGGAQPFPEGALQKERAHMARFTS